MCRLRTSWAGNCVFLGPGVPTPAGTSPWLHGFLTLWGGSGQKKVGELPSKVSDLGQGPSWPGLRVVLDLHPFQTRS